MTRLTSLKKNRLEWTVLGVSTLMVLSVVGLLLHAQFTGAGGPPRLEIAMGAPERQGDTFAVRVTVRNDGATTAEDVRLEIVLRAGDTTERSIVQFPFVPHGARRVAWGTFTRDPSAGVLQARILGYREP